MAVQTTEREPVADWMEFCHHPACGDLFAAWPDNILRIYLLWHTHCRTLIVVHDEASRVLGLATGWQCRERDLGEHWFCTDPAGDCFYFDKLLAANPRALAALIHAFTIRFPQWPWLRLFAHRYGVLREMNRREINMLYRLAQRRSTREDLCETRNLIGT